MAIVNLPGLGKMIDDISEGHNLPPSAVKAADRKSVV